MHSQARDRAYFLGFAIALQAISRLFEQIAHRPEANRVFLAHQFGGGDLD
jgi:hypothetical protein